MAAGIKFCYLLPAFAHKISEKAIVNMSVMAWSDNLEKGTPAFEIASSGNPMVRVVAGPGTGKSFAMKRRVARLLEDGVDSQTILPVTFTRIARMV